jgi:hypothetical protein
MKEDLEGEIWKDVPGYEDLYQVSNMGRVYSLPKEWTGSKGIKLSHKGKLLKVGYTKNGYLKVDLSKNLKKKYFEIHALVAMAFLNHTPCGHEIVVDHIDEDKTNNRVENLQLITQRENILRVKKGKGYSSNFKGVRWHKQANKWHSRITINKKEVSLGLFTEEKDAAKVYQLAVANIDKYNGNNKEFRELIKSLI